MELKGRKSEGKVLFEYKVFKSNLGLIILSFVDK